MSKGGMVIETKHGEFIAGCEGSAHAALLLNVTPTSVYSYVRGTSSNSMFNVRELTDDDELGITNEGKRRLPGWSPLIEHDYLR